MREINTVAIQGNPHIKKGSKPKTPTDLFKLSTDRKRVAPPKPTAEEIEKIKNKFFGDGLKDTMGKD